MTAYCPKSHVLLADESVGIPYGHVPGHQYHDVDVVVSRSGSSYRCHVVESWGSAQERDQEHGRKEAIGRGSSIRAAIMAARGSAHDCGMDASYLAQALCLAEDSAIEAEADAA